MRRHDYSVDIMGGSRGANYSTNYRDFQGVKMPTTRRIYPRDESGRSIAEPLLVTIDFGNLTFSNPITESGAWALIGYNGNSFHVVTNNERGQRIDAGLQGPREQAWQRRACGGYATVAERLNFSHRASDALWRASAPVPIS